MKVERLVPAVMLSMALMGVFLAIASAEEVKYSLKPAATMKALLTDFIGKRVAVRLESGEEMEGTVTMVEDNLVHISKLSRRDFFDAFIAVDRISAVIIRMR